MRELVSFDWALKNILREKANFVVLEGFLSELLKFDLKIEEILESEGNQENDLDKFNRVDLLAKNSKHELILVEVQYSSEIDYFHRMVYGASKLVSEYIQKGKGYSDVKKVYSVNIVYFNLGQGSDYLYYGKTDFIGQKKRDTLQLSKFQKEKFHLQDVYQIFPEYYILKINDFDNVAENSLDEWIYFLKNSEIKSDFSAKGLQEANEKMDYLKLSEEKKREYRKRQENKMLEISLIETQRIEGREEGIVEGEKRKQIEIAKSMLGKKMDLALIAEITNLSITEIERL